MKTNNYYHTKLINIIITTLLLILMNTHFVLVASSSSSSNDDDYDNRKPTKISKDIISKTATEQENSAIFLVAALGKMTLVKAAMNGNLIKWQNGKAHIQEDKFVHYDKKWKDQHAQRTSLHIAAFNGHYETCKLLLENGWDATMRDLRDQTPGDIAYEKEYYDIAKLLGNDAMKNKIDKQFEKLQTIEGTNEHNNALFVAVTRSDRQIIHAAIFNGKELEVDWDDNHQIGIAAGSKRKVKYSRTWGKDGNPKDKMKGWTALHMAVFKNDLEIIKDLIDAGWDRRQKNGQGQIPYELADNWETKNILERHVKRDREAMKKKKNDKKKTNGTDDDAKNDDITAPIENTENNMRKLNAIKGIEETPEEVHEDDAKEIAAYIKKREEEEELARREDEEELMVDEVPSMPSEDL